MPDVASMGRLEALFDELVTLPPDECEERLCRYRRTDPSFGRELESLLTHDRAAVGGFLTRDDLAARRAADDAEPGTIIDRYLIIERLGAGGCGVVYAAEQAEPVRRRVAIKIVKPGMETEEMLARFATERRVLALLDHPNIARILDAGTTPHGRPYFVMELVDGEPIADYCERHQLSLDERLRLFTLVCDAVHHAHLRDIIHRDIKPSNVLVTVRDGVALPKVIDFGVARALHGDAPAGDHATRQGELVGTIEYMSPEQAATGAADLDTRADIYGLGALLYALLTGDPPLSADALRSRDVAELRRFICEIDPPRPSARLGATARRAATEGRCPVIARRRAATVRGDLDHIVMKALAKDRAHRYRSAADLARDVGRHISGDLVTAADPGVRDRFFRYVRRRRRELNLICVTGLLWPLLTVLLLGLADGAALIAVPSLLLVSSAGIWIITRHWSAMLTTALAGAVTLAIICLEIARNVS